MLSNTFKYISEFRHAGHQVGRKVGDMLELLTFAGVNYDGELKSRLNVEPKLFGFSEAGHKVEFVVHKTKPEKTNGGEIQETNKILGFIECKKVGVEQTVNSQFKKAFKKNPNGPGFCIPNNEKIKVTFNKTNTGKKSFQISISDGSLLVTDTANNKLLLNETLEAHHRVIFAVFEDGSYTVLGNNEGLRGFSKKLMYCRIFDVFDIQSEFVIGVLNDCLSGPQTPEKAKQASFVALDVRKKRFGSFDLRKDEKEMISVLVITEFDHWEAKSQNMITACIDYNLVVADELIIDAFKQFEEKFGENFYEKITKEQYQKDSSVSSIIDSIVEKQLGKIFLDIKDNKMKGFKYEDNALTIS